MGRTSLITRSAAAALLALCLGVGGCGGGGSSTNSTSATSGADTAGQPPSSVQPPAGAGRGSGAAKRQAQSGATAKQAPSTSSSQAGPSRPTGAQAFVQPGADNSIPEYGSEGSADEKTEAEEALVGYLSARERRDWATACSLMGSTVRRQMRVLAGAAAGRGATNCTQFYAALSQHVSSAELANVLVGTVAVFRIRGDRGFALFYGPAKQQFMMPMVKEDGRWKVSQSIPIAYPVGAPVRGG